MEPVSGSAGKARKRLARCLSVLTLERYNTLTINIASSWRRSDANAESKALSASSRPRGRGETGSGVSMPLKRPLRSAGGSQTSPQKPSGVSLVIWKGAPNGEVLLQGKANLWGRTRSSRILTQGVLKPRAILVAVPRASIQYISIHLSVKALERSTVILL